MSDREQVTLMEINLTTVPAQTADQRESVASLRCSFLLMIFVLQDRHKCSSRF